MDQKQIVLDHLTNLSLPYQVVEHPAVFTIEEMEKLDFPAGTMVAKNLFLRDAKGKRHFLLVTTANRKIDLKALESKLGSTKLSFASDERLAKYLGLTKGAVSPFGLLNDTEKAVAFYLDDGLRSCEHIGVHPNDSTATVLISFDDLVKFAKETGHEVNFLRF